jgi:hypothetical protein
MLVTSPMKLHTGRPPPLSHDCHQQCGDTAVSYLDILALATRCSCSGMYIYI